MDGALEQNKQNSAHLIHFVISLEGFVNAAVRFRRVLGREGWGGAVAYEIQQDSHSRTRCIDVHRQGLTRAFRDRAESLGISRSPRPSGF